MKFEWDSVRSEQNETKHGVSFKIAKQDFADPLRVSRLDRRFNWFEERWITIGSTESIGIVVVANMVFHDAEEEVIRIISARRATRQEGEPYGR